MHHTGSPLMLCLFSWGRWVNIRIPHHSFWLDNMWLTGWIRHGNFSCRSWGMKTQAYWSSMGKKCLNSPPPNLERSGSARGLMWRSGWGSDWETLSKEISNRGLSWTYFFFFLFSFFLSAQNVTANHRVNDAVFTEDYQQVVTGRFMYGPLDMVTLAGEKVIHLLTSQQNA